MKNITELGPKGCVVVRVNPFIQRRKIKETKSSRENGLCKLGGGQ